MCYFSKGFYYTWKPKDVKAATVILFNYEILQPTLASFFTGGVDFPLSLVTYFNTSKSSYFWNFEWEIII